MSEQIKYVPVKRSEILGMATPQRVKRAGELLNEVLLGMARPGDEEIIIPHRDMVKLIPDCPKTPMEAGGPLWLAVTRALIDEGGWKINFHAPTGSIPGFRFT